jgi:hypothetical protein
MINTRKQGSTTYPYKFFMASSTDHITGVTGLSPTVTVQKSGIFGAASGAVTELGNGWYQLAGHATDRDTLGELVIHAEGTGADPYDGKLLIVPFDPFDADGLGLARLDAAVSTRLATAGYTAPPATGAIVTAMQDAGTHLALIKAKTDNLPVSPAAVGSAMALTPTERSTLAGTIEGSLIDDASGGAFKQAILDKLVADLPDLDDLTLTAIANATRDAIFNRQLAGNHDAAGTAGKLLQDTATAAALTTVGNNVTAVKSKTDQLVFASGDVKATLDGETVGLTAAAIDAFWDELQAGHTTDGSFGKYLDAAVSAVEGGTGGTVDEEALALAVDTQLSATHGSGPWGGSGGAGSGTSTLIIDVLEDGTNNPIADVTVSLYTEAAMTNLVAVADTTMQGRATFYVDPGTYYYRRVKAGWSFANPTSVEVV